MIIASCIMMCSRKSPSLTRDECRAFPNADSVLVDIDVDASQLLGP